MNRNTVILLLLAIGLGGAAWLATRESPPVELPKLKLAGYGPASEAPPVDPMAPSPEVASPIDGLELEIPGEPKLVLRREKSGDEVIWHIDAPKKGRAQGYLVDQIVGLFKTELASREARRYKEADARLFGFEPTRRIRLVAKSQGAVWNGVDLLIGDLRRDRGAGADGAVDTWVMAGSPAEGATPVVWAVGRDLRTAVDQKLADLRDKLILSVKAEDLTEIRIAPAEGTSVTLKAATPPVTAPDADKVDDKADATKEPAPKPVWTLAEPAGAKADAGVTTFAATLAGARAQRFEAADFAAAKEALGGKVWTFDVKTKGGETVVVTLAAGAGEEIWGRVEGSDEVFALAGWAAKGLRKSFEDFRDRDATTFDTAQVTRIDAPKAGEGDAAPTNGARVVLTRDGDSWRFDGEDGAADPTAWLADIKGLKAQRWARPGEAAAAEALGKPAFRVLVGLDGGSTAELVAGEVFDEDGQQLRWARWTGAGAGDAFLVTDFMLKRLAASVDALREKRLFAGKALIRMALTVGEAGARRKGAKGLAPSWVVGRSEVGADWTLEGLAAGEKTRASEVAALGDGVARATATSFETLDWEAATKDLPAESRGSLALTTSDGATLTLRYAMPDGEADPRVTLDAGPLAGRVLTIARADLAAWLKTRADLVEAAPAAPTPAAPVAPAAPATPAPGTTKPAAP
jgi:hypothetical protein